MKTDEMDVIGLDVISLAALLAFERLAWFFSGMGDVGRHLVCCGMMTTEEIRKFLEGDYAQAFSSKQPQQVLNQFAPDSELLFHQLGQDKSGKGGKGKTVRVHTGSLWKALAKGRMPAWVMLRIVFRRLAKSDYDRSAIELIEVQGSFEGSVHAMVRWDRRDSEGEVFEEGYSVLKLDGADGRWKIKEGWTLDDPGQWDADLTGVSFGPLSGG